MGIKERRTRILLAVFLLKDTDFDWVSFNQGERKIFDIAANRKTAATISGLVREGLLEKLPIVNPDQERELGERKFTDQKSNLQDSNSYKLTEKGFYHLCLKFPFFRFLKDNWDGKWRIISYEIPEKKRRLRDRLRREVAGWGLGPWHRSFWLTPHPIIKNLRELVFGKEEEKYIQAFEADHVFGPGEVLVEKVWNKSELDKKYRQVFKIWHEVLSRQGDKIEKFKKVVSPYVDILKQDPGLPREIIGQNWIGFEGWNIYKEIRGILVG